MRCCENEKDEQNEINLVYGGGINSNVTGGLTENKQSIGQIHLSNFYKFF